jgi:protein-L-isoaspartate(D-aspartate) O-methyltransferase
MVNAETRAVYARAVASAARVRDPRVEAAFAEVPRERFLGPPPWEVLGDPGGRRTTSDPAMLYGDVLVAIDQGRGINNGEPQLWAFVLDRLGVLPGARVLHVGAGTGYYTAILAELAGEDGSVTGVEIEPDLARRAAEALADRPQVRIVRGDAVELRELPFDRIVFSCGVTGLPAPWLDRLPIGARVAVPLTGASQTGLFLLLDRRTRGFAAMPLCGVAIYPAASFRDARQERQLDGVRRAGPEALWAARSLLPAADTAPAERIYGFGDWVLSTRAMES